MELKEPLFFEKQIEKLKSHGMVMEEYQDDVDLTFTGFPENYMTLLKNNENRKWAGWLPSFVYRKHKNEKSKNEYCKN